jgi:DNA-binding CsgD family transcriptional regulator
MGAFVLEKNFEKFVFDTIERAPDIATPEELNALFEPACQELGFTKLGAYSVAEPGGRMVGGYHCGSTDPRWEEHYVNERLFERDGVVALLPQTLEVMVWSELLARESFSKASKDVFRQAKAFGLNDGFVLPQHYLNGAVSATILTSPHRISDDPRERAAINILASYYGAVVRRLMAPTSLPSKVSLTPRQRECLQWVRAGKTDWEISRILSISEHTVQEHIEAARNRLGVKNRTQAVIEALQRRLISI